MDRTRRSGSSSPDDADRRRRRETPEARDSSADASLSRARDRNLIGLGLNPSSWSEQTSMSRISHSDTENQESVHQTRRDERNLESLVENQGEQALQGEIQRLRQENVELQRDKQKTQQDNLILQNANKEQYTSTDGTSSLREGGSSSRSTRREGMIHETEQQLEDHLKRLGFKPHDTEWLESSAGQKFLVGHMHDFAKTEQGKAWVNSDNGIKWLSRTVNGLDWLRSAKGLKWLKSDDGLKWLKSDNSRIYTERVTSGFRWAHHLYKEQMEILRENKII